jgi:hypothetical protein
MGMFGGIEWLALYAGAIYLLASKHGNLFIVLGLFGLGLGGFLGTLVSMGFLNYSVLDDFYQIGGLVALVSIALLIVGVTQLFRSGVFSSGTKTKTVMQDAQGVSLATLFIPRNETNTFSKGEKLRDEACDRFLERARQAEFKVIEQRSQAHSPSVWFRLDYLSPAPAADLSLTMSVAVDIERFDFHRFEHLFTISVQVGAKVTKFANVMDLSDATVDRIHQFLMTPGRKLKMPNRVREFPWQLWRPKNKVQRLRPDWKKLGLTALAVAVLLIPIAGIFVAAAIFVYLYLESRKRRTYVLTSGKPQTDPRSLRWMDSWQGSIPKLGSLELTVKKGIIERLLGSGPENTKVEIERIGYWGTDSWVEREQVVVTHRRAIGFVHVEAYGDALFVAWESHLNSASWVEQELAAGVDRETGLDVVANRVVSGIHRINEYDVSDSNFLSEWIHEAVKREIQLRMVEHKIDEEIDFTVQRESRTAAVGTTTSSKPSESKEKKSRFRRVA